MQYFFNSKNLCSYISVDRYTFDFVNRMTLILSKQTCLVTKFKTLVPTIIQDTLISRTTRDLFEQTQHSAQV